VGFLKFVFVALLAAPLTTRCGRQDASQSVVGKLEALIEKGQIGAALELAEKTHREKPDPEIASRRARCLYLLGRWEEALDLSEEDLRRFPQAPSLLFALRPAPLEGRQSRRSRPRRFSILRHRMVFGRCRSHSRTACVPAGGHRSCSGNLRGRGVSRSFLAVVCR
jgi:tetratricopeptide (TPR) repeat protein